MLNFCEKSLFLCVLYLFAIKLPIMKFRTIILSTLMVVLMGIATSAQSNNSPLPKGVERVTSVEGITEYKLPNGLRVLLFPDPSTQTITVNITYLVGSKHENYGETGMAHLLEHLVFKGSPKHTNIPQELTSHGARPNGTTWLDRTNYFETFAATDENLKWALDLESDRMVNSFIAKKDLDSEMTVVRNEFEMGENSPFRNVFQQLFATAYLWHNYGKSTIGARADIENVPIDRLQAFYKKYYQPDNAVLLVAGKIDEAKTLDLVNQYFSPIPKPTRELQKIYTLDPTQDGERLTDIRRVGDTQMLGAAYHIPAGSHPDAAPVRLLLQVMGDDATGRLYKALVETKKASSIISIPLLFGDPSLFIVGAEVRTEQSLSEARDITIDQLEKIADKPITKEEVNRVRQQILTEIELSFNNAENIGLELSEWIGMGDWRLMFINRDRIRKATVEDVQRVAVSYLKQSNRTIVQFIPTAKPDRAIIPATPDVAALVKDYKGDATVARGEAFDSSPGNIEKRTAKSTAPGGLKLSLLSKKTTGGRVEARLMLHFGDDKTLMNKGAAGSFTADLLDHGTAKMTRQQIKDEFDKLKAKVSIRGGNESVNVSLETVRENLPAVLTLVSEILRTPIFPDSELQQLKQEALAGIEQQMSEPEALAFNSISRHMSPFTKGHTRYVETLAESKAKVEAVSITDVKNFYNQFYGADYGELAVVGDFDEKKIALLAGDIFKGWKNKATFKRIADVYKNAPAVDEAIKTPDKANAMLLAALNLDLSDFDPDYPALILGNHMLGGGFINSRLATRIRQKEGLSYDVGSQLRASSLDKNGSFMIYAIFAPQNVTKVEAALKEEIARALQDGFTAEELAEAKKGYLQNREVSRAKDEELVGKLRNYAYINRTLDWDAEFDKKLAAVTNEHIIAAMRKYIDPAKLSIVKAGDFK